MYIQRTRTWSNHEYIIYEFANSGVCYVLFEKSLIQESRTCGGGMGLKPFVRAKTTIAFESVGIIHSFCEHFFLVNSRNCRDMFSKKFRIRQLFPSAATIILLASGYCKLCFFSFHASIAAFWIRPDTPPGSRLTAICFHVIEINPRRSFTTRAYLIFFFYLITMLISRFYIIIKGPTLLVLVYICILIK